MKYISYIVISNQGQSDQTPQYFHLDYVKIFYKVILFVTEKLKTTRPAITYLH